jgi:hypothetical protein
MGRRPASPASILQPLADLADPAPQSLSSSAGGRSNNCRSL